MGVTLASFQSGGTSPVISHLLNKSATVSEISFANSTNIFVPTKSTPGAYLNILKCNVLTTGIFANFEGWQGEFLTFKTGIPGGPGCVKAKSSPLTAKSLALKAKSLALKAKSLALTLALKEENRVVINGPESATDQYANQVDCST